MSSGGNGGASSFVTTRILGNLCPIFQGFRQLGWPFQKIESGSLMSPIRKAFFGGASRTGVSDSNLVSRQCASSFRAGPRMGNRSPSSASWPGKPWKIYLISARGGNAQQLIPGERSEVDQDWSPDGNWLVFGRLIPQHLAEEGPLTVHLLDLRTHKQSTLPGSEGLYTSRWSPDGRYIAAMSEDSQRIFVFDFTTSQWRELARAIVGCLSWSKDGKYIYFDSGWDPDPALCRVSIRDGRIERLYSLKDTREVYGDYGAWFGLDPEDSPLMTRDVGTQEIYALDCVAP
jgi:WD40 repeat protein